MDALPTWVYRGLGPLQPPVLLPVVRAAQRVNDEPVKVLNLLFFVYLLRNLAETFEKLQFLTFGPKQCFYLTHSATEYFEKLAFTKKKKNATLNGCISKARASSESKLKFLEISFNFLQNSVVFARSTHVGTREGALPPTNTGAAASGSWGSKN